MLGCLAEALLAVRSRPEFARQADPEREVHNSEGMTCGRLADILDTEITIYSRD